METIGEYLAQPLPALNFNGRGESPDIPSERIVAALQGVDLSREVPQPGLLGTAEYYGVGTKSSLSGRFVYNACVPVGRALNHTDLRNKPISP